MNETKKKLFKRKNRHRPPEKCRPEGFDSRCGTPGERLENVASLSLFRNKNVRKRFVIHQNTSEPVKISRESLTVCCFRHLLKMAAVVPGAQTALTCFYLAADRSRLRGCSLPGRHIVGLENLEKGIFKTSQKKTKTAFTFRSVNQDGRR